MLSEQIDDAFWKEELDKQISEIHVTTEAQDGLMVEGNGEGKIERMIIPESLRAQFLNFPYRERIE